MPLQDAIAVKNVDSEENYLYSGIVEGEPKLGNGTGNDVFLAFIRKAEN